MFNRLINGTTLTKLNTENICGKDKHSIRESQTKVDNGVHPLHWDTSPGPSPMGTDPINGFKMVQIWFWHQLQQ